MSIWSNRLLLSLIVCCLALVPITTTRAEGTAGWQVAADMQTLMRQANLALIAGEQERAVEAVAQAQQRYAVRLQPLARPQSPATEAATAALAAASAAARDHDLVAFAAADGRLRTALYQIGYDQTMAALAAGDAPAAQEWLLLRDFRAVSRVQRIRADATRAVAALSAGTMTAAAAQAAVRADLLDTYQARLSEALHELAAADARGLAAGRAQSAALAEGYFALLAPAYAEQRGAAALTTTQRAFADLRQAARAGQPVAPLLPEIEAALRGFRAAPLSPEEQARRAGQLLRFLQLVPVEYGRGVKDGRVTIELEIQEAVTFRDGAAAAFADLRSLLETRDPAGAAEIEARFAALEQQLAAAKAQSAVAEPATIQAETDELTARLRAVMPADWQRRDNSADFDVIRAALDQMEAAVAAGQYDLAESARLEAYAILESGPEAKLIVFAPEHTAPLEGLFWYGEAERPGLAALIQQQAPAGAIQATRAALDEELTAAERALAGNNAPAAVATNAGVIVFREGLEAVLILASLMASLRQGAQRALRRPLWWGVLAAGVATVLTWALARGLLTAFASYGERLEAIVSLVAIGVLILITNWFFHDVYWIGWMAGFHARKRQLVGREVGQWLGLATLGFTSIYREGFETVLFLQALVLEAGTAVVLAGVALGLAGTLAIGGVVFILQAKLPGKKMLVVTGVMIGAVLLVMVGNTAHVLQVVGWLPIHPLRGLALPYWTGLWFGVYATWEGLALQAAAGSFVIGSYFVAERLRHRRARTPRAQSAADQVLGAGD